MSRPGVISQKKKPILRRAVENEWYNIWRQRSASFFTLVSGFTNIKIVISRTCCGCLALKRIRLPVDEVTDIYMIRDENRTKRVDNIAMYLIFFLIYLKKFFNASDFLNINKDTSHEIT